jgi:hypothetical protein
MLNQTYNQVIYSKVYLRNVCLVAHMFFGAIDFLFVMAHLPTYLMKTSKMRTLSEIRPIL